MAEVAIAVGSLLSIPRHDDDVTDRLNHRVTKSILVGFAIAVAGLDFLKVDKIVCWVPVHFSDYQEEYAEEYCWVRNTYQLPFTDNIPHEEDTRQMVTYYQWVPAILLLQALMFHLPCSIWRTYNRRCGMDVADFVEKSQALPMVGIVDELRQRTLNHLAAMMSRFTHGQSADRKKQWTLSLKHVFSATCLRPLGGGRGRFLVSLYLFCKLLFLANVVGQIFMLDKLLGMDYHVYGVKVIEDYINGSDWTSSTAFPRTTLCDFKVRRLGNVQRYTVQCALPLNLYNEKIFLFVYFWLIFVALMTFLSFIRWVALLGPPSRRHGYVRRHLLQALEAEKLGKEGGVRRPINLENHERCLDVFVDKYLKADGVFVLRLTGRNVDMVSEEDLVLAVWRRFKAERGVGDRLYGHVAEDGQPSSPLADRLSKFQLTPNNIGHIEGFSY